MYAINTFLDTQLARHIKHQGGKIDMNLYSLGQMLQWVYRSRIRDNKSIELYIPSRRMRRLMEVYLEGHYIDKTETQSIVVAA